MGNSVFPFPPKTSDIEARSAASRSACGDVGVSFPHTHTHTHTQKGQTLKPEAHAASRSVCGDLGVSFPPKKQKKTKKGQTLKLEAHLASRRVLWGRRCFVTAEKFRH